MAGGMSISRKPPAGGTWGNGSVASRLYYRGPRLDYGEIMRMREIIRVHRSGRGVSCKYDPSTDEFLLEVGLIRYIHDRKAREVEDQERITGRRSEFYRSVQADYIEPVPFGKFDNGLLDEHGAVRAVWHMDKKQYRRSGRHHRSGSARHIPVNHVAYQM